MEDIKAVENEVKEAVKTKYYGVKLSWWLIVIAIVSFGGVFAANYLSQKSNATKTKTDTSEEIQIKQTLSSTRGTIVRYFEDKKTYVGWTPDENLKEKIKSLGSEVKTQSLSKDNYIIFAKMPNSKLIFCMDVNFTGEVSTLFTWQKSCKQ